MKMFRRWLNVTLVGAMSMGVLSGYTGGCGIGEPPPSASCRQDSDCGQGYRCERLVYIQGGDQPMTGSAQAGQGGGSTSAGSADSLGVRCIGAEGGDLTTRCGALPPPDQEIGQCVKVSPKKKKNKKHKKNHCQSDADCGPRSFCAIPPVRCLGVAPESGTQAAEDICQGPTFGTCQPRPLPPPPSRSCEQSSDCGASEICSFESEPHPLPVEDGGSAPSPKPDAPTQPGEGSAPSEGERSLRGLGEGVNDAPSLPCMPEPLPEPPVRRGICVPAPKPTCSSDADCPSGLLCAFPVPPSEPTRCSSDDAGTTRCGGAPIAPPSGVCIHPAP